MPDHRRALDTRSAGPCDVQDTGGRLTGGGMRPQVSWTTAAERSLLIDQALDLLETVGMRFGRSAALESLGAAGARVDREAGVARLPRELVERALGSCPREVLLAGATEADDVLLDGSAVHFVPSGTPTKILDEETGRVRSGTVEDVRRAVIVADAMPAVDVMWAPVGAADLPKDEMAWHEFVTAVEWSPKHFQHEVTAAWQQKGSAGPGDATQVVVLSPAERGKKIFSANCATCHQASGLGVAGQYPPLAGSEYVMGGTRRLGMIVLKGLEGPLTVKGAQYGSAVMQPWEKTLNDAKIADVLTYIRQEWGNTGGPVAPEGIAGLRKELAGHAASFKEADLKAVPDDANLPGGEGAAPPKPDANAPAPQPKA